MLQIENLQRGRPTCPQRNTFSLLIHIGIGHAAALISRYHLSHVPRPMGGQTPALTSACTNPKPEGQSEIIKNEITRPTISSDRHVRKKKVSEAPDSERFVGTSQLPSGEHLRGRYKQLHNRSVPVHFAHLSSRPFSHCALPKHPRRSSKYPCRLPGRDNRRTKGRMCGVWMYFGRITNNGRSTFNIQPGTIKKSLVKYHLAWHLSRAEPTSWL